MVFNLLNRRERDSLLSRGKQWYLQWYLQIENGVACSKNKIVKFGRCFPPTGSSLGERRAWMFIRLREGLSNFYYLTIFVHYFCWVPVNFCHFIDQGSLTLRQKRRWDAHKVA